MAASLAFAAFSISAFAADFPTSTAAAGVTLAISAFPSVAFASTPA